MSEEQPIDISKIRPLGSFLLVRKCVQPEPDLIILPDQAKEQTNFVEILAVGNKCKFFDKSHIGMTVQCPEYGDGMHPIVEGSSEYWFVKESLIDPIVYE